MEYHTYPLSHLKQPRVTLKGIPPNVTTDEIATELNQRNLPVNIIRQIVRTDKPTAKIIVKYPVFVVTIKTGTEYKDIYKTTNLCHCIVRWERYKAKRPVQQCYRCQQFGHASMYCGRPARCVKCKHHHSTQDCTKLPPNPQSVSTVGGAHPANYSGCPEY